MCFASVEAISKDHKDFVIACHETWKYLHQQAIRKILFFDGFLKREKEHPIGPAVEYFGNYEQAIWRKVNDAIVWSLVGQQRHIVKRLCLYRKRGYLSEANPDSAMAFIDDVNRDPMKLALWNDATSCVDIGDATVIEDGLLPIPSFVELKEGKVNKAILDLMGEGEQLTPTQIGELETAHGPKARKQYERVQRQKKTSNLALELLNTEEGTDPVSGQPMRVFDLQMVPERYDEELVHVLEVAIATKGEAYDLIDGCLWLYANCSPSLNRETAAAKFYEFLAGKLGARAPVPPSRATRRDKDRAVPLGSGVWLPMAKPLFLRPIGSKLVAEVLLGDAMDRVFLYLDWEKFGELVRDKRATFRWSTEKETRRLLSQQRELQPPIFRGKVPLVEQGEAKMFVTDPNLVEVFFDGERPTSLVEKLMKTLSHMPMHSKSS